MQSDNLTIEALLYNEVKGRIMRELEKAKKITMMKQVDISSGRVHIDIFDLNPTPGNGCFYCFQWREKKITLLYFYLIEGTITIKRITRIAFLKYRINQFFNNLLKPKKNEP